MRVWITLQNHLPQQCPVLYLFLAQTRQISLPRTMLLLLFALVSSVVAFDRRIVKIAFRKRKVSNFVLMFQFTLALMIIYPWPRSLLELMISKHGQINLGKKDQKSPKQPMPASQRMNSTAQLMSTTMSHQDGFNTLRKYRNMIRLILRTPTIFCTKHRMRCKICLTHCKRKAL